jgi:outer membrane protein assembly factor BamC
MRSALSYLVLLFTALALAACGGFEIPTKKIEYKSAGKLPPLDVPPDLTRPTGDDRFVVPDVGTTGGSATFSAYEKDRNGGARRTASGSGGVLPVQDDAHIERAGTQRWLVVNVPPEKLWPVVKEFWQETGFLVNVEMPEAGVMETDWN